MVQALMNEITPLPFAIETPAKFSAREFIRMKEIGAFEGMKVELVEGDIIRMNPPYIGHGAKQAVMIWQLAEAYESVQVVVAGETGVQLDANTIGSFDAVVFRDAPLDMKLLDPALVILAVEIADTTLDRDLGPKMREYAAAGIPEYWVIDTNKKQIHIMRRPKGDKYGYSKVARFGDEIKPPGGVKAVMVV